MKACWWAADDSGSAYYRCNLPSNALRWIDHDAVSLRDITQIPWPADVLIGARQANPGPVELWERIRKDDTCTLVYDLDDDYLHIDAESNPQAYAFWDRDTINRMLKAVNLAHRVTVVSEALAEVMRDHHHDVVVVPNGLHAGWLAAPREYRDDRPVRIGWAGTQSTVHELPLAAKALNRILDYKGPGGQPTLTCIGAPQAWIVKMGITHERVDGTGIIAGTDRYLTACAEHFDIWVAPYRDIPFNASKFATKGLEAGMLGIPLVASAIRPYEEWIEHGVNGFLVRQSHEWGRYLKRLVDDVDLRAKMGRAARAKASNYVMQGLALDWESALTEGIKR